MRPRYTADANYLVSALNDRTRTVLYSVRAYSGSNRSVSILCGGYNGRNDGGNDTLPFHHRNFSLRRRIERIIHVHIALVIHRVVPFYITYPQIRMRQLDVAEECLRSLEIRSTTTPTSNRVARGWTDEPFASWSRAPCEHIVL